MNSKQRHEVRYQRRKAKREEKRIAAASGSFEDVMSFENLCKAGKRCCNGSRWKTSTINFENNLLGECNEIHGKLARGAWKFHGFRSFITVEHGKLRHIDALKIGDRAVQKCLCENLLTRSCSRSFVYDNSASLKGKGMDFQLKRLKKHLHDHYRRYGTEGGIYQFDFKGYFDSIPHGSIKERAKKFIEDERIYSLFCDLVDEFLKMGTATGEPRGIGLGSEVSQMIALDYASPIDHYIKDRLGKHGFGRYNDDGYVTSDSLDELHVIKDALYKMSEEMGLKMSDKKNIITPFRHHSFVFLKMRFTLKDGGKVIMKLSKRSIRAMRRKMDIFRRWLDCGKLKAMDVIKSYQSWRAHAKRCNSHNTLIGMDRRFVTMFGNELAERKKPFKCTIKPVHTPAGWTYPFKARKKLEAAA